MIAVSQLKQNYVKLSCGKYNGRWEGSADLFYNGRTVFIPTQWAFTLWGLKRKLWYNIRQHVPEDTYEEITPL